MEWIRSNPIVSHYIVPAVDILIVAFLFYRGYLLIRGTRAVELLKGIIIIVISAFAAEKLQLKTLAWLLKRFLDALVIILVVVFQPELRKILSRIGAGSFKKLLMTKEKEIVEELTEAIMAMSSSRIGAILAFERKTGLYSFAEQGVELDAFISKELLITIFYPSTPLHDGGVIIKGDKIIAASCIFPVAEEVPENFNFGTRHRAALGLSQETDALVITVSEETGKVSVAEEGNFKSGLTRQEIQNLLSEYYTKGG